MNLKEKMPAKIKFNIKIQEAEDLRKKLEALVPKLNWNNKCINVCQSLLEKSIQ